MGQTLARVRSKICGIRNLEDALVAIDSGADALGFVFYPPSPRNVSIETAAMICKRLPPFVTTVGLFVNMDESAVREILAKVPLALLQFHGDETEDECLCFDKPYIKAVRVQNANDVAQAENHFPSAQGLLVDAYRPGVPGGTGESFDWSLLPSERKLPLILAGGLKAENIRKAIDFVRPYGVDVSGGVESQKGIKDHRKIKEFLKEVSSER